jgi:hypothetical protein
MKKQNNLNLTLFFLLGSIFSACSAYAQFDENRVGSAYDLTAGVMYRQGIDNSRSGEISASPKGTICDPRSPDRRFCGTGNIPLNPFSSFLPTNRDAAPSIGEANPVTTDIKSNGTSNNLREAQISENVIYRMVTDAVEPVGSLAMHDVLHTAEFNNKNAADAMADINRSEENGALASSCIQRNRQQASLSGQPLTYSEAVQICTGGNSSTGFGLPSGLGFARSQTGIQGAGGLTSQVSARLVMPPGGIPIPQPSGTGVTFEDLLQAYGCNPTDYLPTAGGCQPGYANIFDIAACSSAYYKENLEKRRAFGEFVKKYVQKGMCIGLKPSAGTNLPSTSLARSDSLTGRDLPIPTAIPQIPTGGGNELDKAAGPQPLDPDAMRGLWADLTIEIYNTILGQMHRSCMTWKNAEEVYPVDVEQRGSTTNANAPIAFPWQFGSGYTTPQQNQAFVEFVSNVDAYTSSSRHQVPWQDVWRYLYAKGPRDENGLLDCDTIDPARIEPWMRDVIVTPEYTRLRINCDNIACTTPTKNYLRGIKTEADIAARAYMRELIALLFQKAIKGNVPGYLYMEAERIIYTNFDTLPQQDQNFEQVINEARQRVFDKKQDQLGSIIRGVGDNVNNNQAPQN